MTPEEIRRVESATGAAVREVRSLAGGYSHATSLVELADGGRVVVRCGGEAPLVEAAVMREAARAGIPVPAVRHVLPASDGGDRALTVLEFVEGELLGEVLEADRCAPEEAAALGAEVGSAISRIGRVSFDRPGFFDGERLAPGTGEPWSAQLPAFARQCMARTPAERLAAEEREAWAALCARLAPALDRVDAHARLVHADANPKNILISRRSGAWRVAAVLDWEFAFSGSPYADAANMLRFERDYPAGFREGFRAGFAARPPAGLPLEADWLFLGRILDMFALSDLATRPPGHAIADRAAAAMRGWLEEGVPDRP